MPENTVHDIVGIITGDVAIKYVVLQVLSHMVYQKTLYMILQELSQLCNKPNVIQYEGIAAGGQNVLLLLL